VRISIRTEGGLAAFPGLSAPRVVDTDTAPAELTAELAELIEAADFFNLPPRVSDLPAGAADYRCFTITVEDGPRSHTVEVVESAGDPTLRRLVDRLRSASRPG
jgi:hypothetical protein